MYGLLFCALLYLLIARVNFWIIYPIYNNFEWLHCHLFQEDIYYFICFEFAIKVWLAKADCQRITFVFSDLKYLLGAERYISRTKVICWWLLQILLEWKLLEASERGALDLYYELSLSFLNLQELYEFTLKSCPKVLLPLRNFFIPNNTNRFSFGINLDLFIFLMCQWSAASCSLYLHKQASCTNMQVSNM